MVDSHLERPLDSSGSLSGASTLARRSCWSVLVTGLPAGPETTPRGSSASPATSREASRGAINPKGSARLRGLFCLGEGEGKVCLPQSLPALRAGQRHPKNRAVRGPVNREAATRQRRAARSHGGISERRSRLSTETLESEVEHRGPSRRLPRRHEVTARASVPSGCVLPACLEITKNPLLARFAARQPRPSTRWFSSAAAIGPFGPGIRMDYPSQTRPSPRGVWVEMVGAGPFGSAEHGSCVAPRRDFARFDRPPCGRPQMGFEVAQR
jgi:hypothetical protein